MTQTIEVWQFTDQDGNTFQWRARNGVSELTNMDRLEALEIWLMEHKNQDVSVFYTEILP